MGNFNWHDFIDIDSEDIFFGNYMTIKITKKDNVDDSIFKGFIDSIVSLCNDQNYFFSLKSDPRQYVYQGLKVDVKDFEDMYEITICGKRDGLALLLYKIEQSFNFIQGVVNDKNNSQF